MLPAGFLGTRADVLMDVVLVVVVLTPFLVRAGFLQARKRNLERHRNVLAALVTVILAAVVLFELDVRLSGGSGSLMAGSRYAGTTGLRVLTIAHVLGNVATFLLWVVLAVMSWKRFQRILPGEFSRRHMKLGRWVYAGTIYGAVTALLMYVAGFIL